MTISDRLLRGIVDYARLWILIHDYHHIKENLDSYTLILLLSL